MTTGGHLLPREAITTIDEYLATDTGGLGVARAQDIGPEATRAVIERSGLRGRGGGGFPHRPEVVRCRHAGRGSPCTSCATVPKASLARSRTARSMRANPYQLVEGVIIAAFAVGAQEAFIAMKSHFTQELEAVTRAVQEMQQAGICSDCVGEHRRRSRRVPVR